jgi:lipoprotein-releasing system permease protein
VKIASILFLAERWGLRGPEGKFSVRTILASGGIAVGVMALIVVIGVMSGFQGGYIESLVNVSSFHIRVEVGPMDASKALASIRGLPEVSAAISFKQTNLIAVGASQQPVVLSVRLLEPLASMNDPALVRSLGVPKPERFPQNGAIVLGREAASLMGVTTGDTISLSGIYVDPENGMTPYNFRIPVGQTFKSNYYEFDSSMAYLDATDENLLGHALTAMNTTIGIMLKEQYSDYSAIYRIKKALGNKIVSIESWRDYNRSFFGALRMEKIMMMLLVSLIFLVVAINIYHAMRRNIALRQREIAVLKAVGANEGGMRSLFLIQGLTVGVLGTIVGIAAGIALADNVNGIIDAFATVARSIASLLQYFGIVRKSTGDYLLFSPAYFYIEKIPVTVSVSDIVSISVIAIVSTCAASVFASRKVLESKSAEVFRNE